MNLKQKIRIKTIEMKKLMLILFVINVYTNIYAAVDYTYDWELPNELKVGSYNSQSLYMFDKSVTLPHMASGTWNYEYFYIDGTYLGVCSDRPGNFEPIGHTLDLSPYADGKIHQLRCSYTYAYASDKEYICYFLAKSDPINKISYWFYNTNNTATVCGIDKGIEVINIPDTVELNGTIFDVTSIGQYAMYESENLKNVTLPPSIKSIGKNAFDGCVNLEEIIIPEGTTFIGSNAFRNTTSLKSLYLQRGNVEMTVEGNPFTDSGVESLFLGRDVYGVLGVGEALQSVQVGSNVTFINENQFIGCSSLNTIQFFEGNLKTINSGAFQGCSSLKEITIPNTVEEIKSGAFKNCKALETVNLSSKLTEIADETFQECLSLPSIKLPNGIISIGNNAFYACQKLEDINLPDGITKIGDWAFANCAFSNILLPNNLKHIGDDAFYLCWKLQSIKIPNSVISIGKEAFEDCESMVEAILSENLTYIPDYLFNGCNLQSIVIPEKVTSIGRAAFNYNSLQSIELPAGLTTIGDQAFAWNLLLDEITIPANVTKIGSGAFNHCDNLTTVYSFSSVPPTCADAKAFSQSTYQNAVLWVPATAIEDYMTFVGWKEFRHYDALSSVTSIKLTGESNTLRINRTMNLEAIITPADHSATKLNWSSSNPFVATVDEFGLVTALSPGFTVITAKAQDIIATEGTFELTVLDYILGDSNNSDDVTITDAVNIASYVMGDNPPIFNFNASDVNESGDITLADASGVITIILDDTNIKTNNISSKRFANSSGDKLKAANFTISSSQNAVVPVSIESSETYVALQADICRCGGLKISNINPSATLADSHLLVSRRINEDMIRVIIYSPALNPLPVSDTLFEVEVSGVPGEGSGITVKNILATSSDLSEYYLGFEGGICDAISTGIDYFGTNEYTIKIINGGVEVANAESMEIQLFTPNGMLIAETVCATDKEFFALPSGIYVIKVGNKAEKIVVR